MKREGGTGFNIANIKQDLKMIEGYRNVETAN